MSKFKVGDRVVVNDDAPFMVMTGVVSNQIYEVLMTDKWLIEVLVEIQGRKEYRLFFADWFRYVDTSFTLSEIDS